MREIEGIDLSMLRDDSDFDRRANVRELADGIVNNFEQQRANMGVDVILQCEALMFEKKIDTSDAHWTFEKVLQSMGPELEKYFKSFHQGLRKSQAVWDRILSDKINLARKLQEQPKSIFRLKDFVEAEKAGFSRVLYVPDQFQNLSIKDLGQKMVTEYEMKFDDLLLRENQIENEPRPDHIYPLVFSSSLNDPNGYLKGRFESVEDVLEELIDRKDKLPEKNEFELSGLTTREYILFQAFAYALKGFFRDDKELCLLLDSKCKKSSKTIGFASGGVKKDGKASLRLASITTFPKNVCCRFVLRKKR